MIRKYQAGDEHGLDANEFTLCEPVTAQLSDDTWLKYTCEDAQGIHAVVVFQEFAPGEYKLFGLFSKTVRPRHGIELRELLEDGIDYFKAHRIVTLSVACEKLDRWHRFLGFEIEEARELDGQKFWLWGRAV